MNSKNNEIKEAIIPRPRYRGSGDNPYETEEEYVEYLNEYYNNYFPSTENNLETLNNSSSNYTVINEKIDDDKYNFTFDIFADSITDLSNDTKELDNVDNIDNVITNIKDSNDILNGKITMPSFATIVKKFFSDIISNIYASQDIDYEEDSKKTR